MKIRPDTIEITEDHVKSAIGYDLYEKKQGQYGHCTRPDVNPKHFTGTLRKEIREWINNALQEAIENAIKNMEKKAALWNALRKFNDDYCDCTLEEYMERYGVTINNPNYQPKPELYKLSYCSVTDTNLKERSVFQCKATSLKDAREQLKKHADEKGIVVWYSRRIKEHPQES